MFDEKKNKIEELRKQANELESQIKDFEKMPSDKRLAYTLHDILCRHNHSDGCGWFYEIIDGKHDWNGQSHLPYLKNARYIESFCDLHSISTDTAIDLLKLARAL